MDVVGESRLEIEPNRGSWLIREVMGVVGVLGSDADPLDSTAFEFGNFVVLSFLKMNRLIKALTQSIEAFSSSKRESSVNWLSVDRNFVAL